MLIRLFKCDGCWRITDNFQTEDGTWTKCECNRNLIRQVNPTLFNMFKWIITSPVYVFKHILIRDIREKYHGN